MALIRCKACSANISEKAKTCPQCGEPTPKKTSMFTWVVGGFFALVIAMSINASYKADEQRAADTAQKSAKLAAMSPQERLDAEKAEAVRVAAATQKERDFQAVVLGAKLVKASTKNPASFELLKAGKTDGGALCYTYRGTNSFNAVVPGTYVIAQNVSSNTAEAWSKHCANKNMTDFSYARQAL